MELRLKANAGVLAVTALAGCGSSVTPPSTTVESAQQPAKPPAGWHTTLDNAHGFSIALPPGWRNSGRAGAVLYRSPDHLVAVSLSVDRTPGAFVGSPASFARQTLRALPGYEHSLAPSPPHPISATPLDAALLTATGVTKQGSVRQEVEVAVLRRDHLVNYTAVIAANAAATPPQEISAARVMVASLRDLPIT